MSRVEWARHCPVERCSGGARNIDDIPADVHGVSIDASDIRCDLITFPPLAIMGKAMDFDAQHFVFSASRRH